jgi:hypothetical protein
MKKQITQTTSQIWDRLPLLLKGVVIVGGTYVAYKIVKNILDKSRLNEQVRDSKQEIDGWNRELQIQSGIQKPTLSEAEMKAIANRIEACLDGYGTRDAELINQFKLIKNNADLAGVYTAFGVRTIEAGRGIGWLAGNERGTLAQVIMEADAETLAEINRDLTKKGIKYKI